MQDAVALLLRRRLRDRCLRRGEVGFGGRHLVLVVDGAELGELLALPHDGADVDLARGEAAADLEPDLAHVARLDAAGALSHEGVLMRRDDDDTRRPRSCGRGCFSSEQPARQTQATQAHRNGLDDRCMAGLLPRCASRGEGQALCWPISY